MARRPGVQAVDSAVEEHRRVGRLHRRPNGDDRRNRRGAPRHGGDVRCRRASRRRSARSPRRGRGHDHHQARFQGLGVLEGGAARRRRERRRRRRVRGAHRRASATRSCGCRKALPIGPLAKLATSASRAKRMIAHGLANGVEGFLSGIPSAAAGSLVDEKTWTQGDPLTNFATATGMGAATGALMGGVMGSAGGWSKAAAHGPHLDPSRPPDLEAAARAFDEAPALPAKVDPATRAGQWHAHQAEHPGAVYADFLADLEAGRIVPEPGAAHGFRRAARAAGWGLPASDRRLLEDVPVHVLTDAEFIRVTRSSKGQAVTIIEEGKAIVLVRERSHHARSARKASTPRSSSTHAPRPMSGCSTRRTWRDGTRSTSRPSSRCTERSSTWRSTRTAAAHRVARADRRHASRDARDTLVDQPPRRGATCTTSATDASSSRRSDLSIASRADSGSGRFPFVSSNRHACSARCPAAVWGRSRDRRRPFTSTMRGGSSASCVPRSKGSRARHAARWVVSE